VTQPELDSRAQTVDRRTTLRPVESIEPAPFEIAYICTANQFRSPLAEAVTAHLLDGAFARVSSVGVLDLPPTPPLRSAVQVARKLRIDLTTHRSRPLEPGALDDASLVIGFERAHVQAAVVDGGSDPERTFMLTELVQLLLAAGAGTTVAGATPEELVSRLQPARQLLPSFGYSQVPDPASASPSVQRALGIRVADVVARAALTLFPDQDGPRATSFLSRLEHLKRKSQRPRFGLFGASNAARAGDRG
jgi:protein-tyrosine-phosphatase